MSTCFLALLLSTGVLSAEVNTLEGEFVSGEILALNEGSLLLRVGEGEQQELSRESLLQLVASTETVDPAGPIKVQMTDGTRMFALAYTSEQGGTQVQLSGGRQLEFPSNWVAHVRFWPANATLQADWQRILALELSGDVLILRRAADSLDYLEGLAGDVTPETAGFTFEDREYSADRQRVEGVLYAAAGELELAPLVCVLEEVDGSRWQASEIVMDGNFWQLTTRLGIEVRVPVSQTRLLDFSSDKLVYLSSLEPDRQSWSPFLEAGFPLMEARYAPRFDESLDGGPMQLLVERDGNQEEMSFTRGIALHSRSEMVYRLPDGFRRFRALVGIDERVRPHGSVWLEIQGDDDTLFEGEIFSTTFEGQPMAAVPLDLNIEGVSRLTIRVDFGEGQDVGDHLNLANAQIRK